MRLTETANEELQPPACVYYSECSAACKNGYIRRLQRGLLRLLTEQLLADFRARMYDDTSAYACASLNRCLGTVAFVAATLIAFSSVSAVSSTSASSSAIGIGSSSRMPCRTSSCTHPDTSAAPSDEDRSAGSLQSVR